MGELSVRDLQVGDRVCTGFEIEVTAEDIIAFARQYDPQAWHLGEAEARDTPFGALVASGWQTAAITMRLLVELDLGALIGVGVTLNWPTPTYPGDRLHVDLAVTGKRDSKSRPGRRLVTIEYDTLNQFGEVRQHTTTTVMTWDDNSS